MDKSNNQEHSIQNNSDASKRVVRSKVSVELHLLPNVRVTMPYFYQLPIMLNHNFNKKLDH
jgi:hypothetical protein